LLLSVLGLDSPILASLPRGGSVTGSTLACQSSGSLSEQEEWKGSFLQGIRYFRLEDVSPPCPHLASPEQEHGLSTSFSNLTPSSTSAAPPPLPPPSTLHPHPSRLKERGKERHNTHKSNRILPSPETNRRPLHIIRTTSPTHQFILPPSCTLKCIPIDQPSLRLPFT